MSCLRSDEITCDVLPLAVQLARKAASYGETVLLLDACGGALLETAGVISGRDLGDVVRRGAELDDALYVTSNEHFTAAAMGDLPLGEALGTLAALSLAYDWVFIVPEAGLTPAHVKLCASSDAAMIGYGTPGDAFMRAYWMIEAVRRRAPKFDPFMVSTGPKQDAVDTALMLCDTVRDHLGAPPPYAGHSDDIMIAPRLLGRVREITDQATFAVGL